MTVNGDFRKTGGGVTRIRVHPWIWQDAEGMEDLNVEIEKYGVKVKICMLAQILLTLPCM